jgi:hypothetical protein
VHRPRRNRMELSNYRHAYKYGQATFN